MRITMDRFLNLLGCSALSLVFLAACAQLPAATLQQQVSEDGCLKYQDPKTVALQKKFRHPALDKGCVACHLDCRAPSPKGDGRQMPAYYLKANEPGLCLECHAAMKKDLAPAHDNQPLGQVKCSGCHDPHAANLPKRIPDFSHGPYGARLCSACHPAPVNGKVQLTAADTDSLCYKCHTEKRQGGAKNQHPPFSQSNGSCVECHDPHAANRKYFLKKPDRVLCLGCHDSNAQRITGQPSSQNQSGKPKLINLSSKHVHEPVGLSCLVCHNAHSSDFPKGLRAPVYDLCMGCHGADAEKITGSSQPFSLFDGQVTLPAKPFEKLTQLDLSSKYLHEPVGKSCVFCHDAHASDFSKELHAPVDDVCISCHGADAPKIVQSSQPFPLFDGQVILPPKAFEQLRYLELTPDGKGHPTMNHPIHGPATADKAELNCLTCHTPHSTSSDPHFLVTDKKSLCLHCHKT